MAIYDEEDIDRMIEQVTEKDETKYFKNAAQGVGEMLIEEPQIYKTFGPYWWAFKDMLRKHYSDGEAWFLGNDDQPVVRVRNWHQTLFRTCLAGLYYHGQQDEHKTDHFYDYNGVTIPYTLVDHDIV